MRKTRLYAAFYHYYLLFVLLAAIAISGGRNFLFKKEVVEIKVGLPEIQQVYPEARQFSHNRHGVYEAFSANGQFTGNVYLSSNYSQEFGYAGIVPLLIGVDQNRIISMIIVLPNKETGDYVEAIYSEKFIGQWNGISLENAINQHPDAVSGATHTSRAVIAGVRQTAAHVMNAEASLATVPKFWSVFKDLLFLTMVLASVMMAYQKGRSGFRTIYLVMVILIMGLTLNNLLSIRQINGWLLEGFVWRVQWQSIVVFGLALALGLAGKRRFYCNYLCPMGALQELTNKFSPIRKRKLPGRFWGISSKELYLMLIAGALLTGFKPELAYLEPFMFFSFNIIGFGMISFGLVVVVLALFFHQPWCSLCPTGCLMDTIPFKQVKYTETKHADHAEK